jgi:vacuolar protein sorting-associated protein 3
MTYAPTNPYDVPPYQVQPLIRSVVENDLHRRGSSLVQVRCAQALGMWNASSAQTNNSSSHRV